MEQNDKWIADFNIDWWNAEYKEPITENCIACKYDETEEEDGKHCKKCLAGNSQFELDKEFVEPTTKNDLGVDCISRADVLNHLANIAKVKAKSDAQKSLMGRCLFMVESLPSVTPQPCEDAVSRQEVLYLIADYDLSMGQVVRGIHALPSVTPQELRWIPVSEKLPNDRDWYLGIFKEPDTGWINPLPFICDYVGRETKATTKEYWILHGFTDMDEHIDYYFNLECVAWMPLQPYREVEE